MSKQRLAKETNFKGIVTENKNAQQSLANILLRDECQKQLHLKEVEKTLLEKNTEYKVMVIQNQLTN
jgi:hypothetical protein